MRPAASPPHAACAAAAGLTWALVDGELRHVSAYAALPPRERPPARCPACGGEVTLKLGRVRAHHVAHRSGEECAASRPESVLHLNVKCHVAAALRAAIGRDLPLRLREPCVVGRLVAMAGARPLAALGAGMPAPWEQQAMPCAETRDDTWLAPSAWDEVELERTLAGDGGTRRPDIVLRRDGRAVGAIEIRHHHAVDDEKARTLAALAVPWVEVAADERLVDGENGAGWRVDEPLPVVQRGPDAPWRCRRHLAQRTEWLRERRAAARAEREAARRRGRLAAVRLVDLYYPSGNRTRLLYRVEAVERDGAVAAYALHRDGMPVAEVRAADGPDAGEASVGARLRAAFRAELRELATRHAAVVDSPMRWATGAVAAGIARLAAGGRAGLLRTHPPRYRWAPAQGRWFRPADLAAVSWDRAPDEPLEPHPAALRTAPPRRARRLPGTPVVDPRNPRTPDATASTATASTAPSVVREEPADDAHRLTDAEVGPCVAAREELAGATVYVLAEAPGGAPTRRVLVVPTARLRAAAVRAMDARLLAAGRERLWLSYAADWTRELADVPWLPVFRLPTGPVMVSLWGRSLRLADVSAAIARGDRRFRPAALERSNPAGRLAH